MKRKEIDITYDIDGLSLDSAIEMLQQYQDFGENVRIDVKEEWEYRYGGDGEYVRRIFVVWDE